MSSEFTEYQLENGQGVEVYASTNKFMRFALEALDKTYVPLGPDSISYWKNSLLPIELKEIKYLPAIKHMENWLEVFFSKRSRKGLIRQETEQSELKLFQRSENLLEEERVSNPNGMWKACSRNPQQTFRSVVYTYDSNTVDMLRRMHEFLN